jgi:hypothetical protein
MPDCGRWAWRATLVVAARLHYTGVTRFSPATIHCIETTCTWQHACSIGRKRGGTWRRLLPLVLIAAVLLLIAAREMPWVKEGFDRLVHPQRWAAGQACRDRVVELARQPDYARIIERGQVHPTRRGYYVDGIVVGQMGEGGTEERFPAECYTDAEGKVVRVGVTGKGG